MAGANAQPDAGTPEIIAQAVVRSFNGRTVLRGISGTFVRGQLTAIVGASGCGKTVLLDHLTGLLSPDSGRVLVTDHSASPEALVDLGECDDDRLDEIRLYWSVVFQRNALFTGTVEENISLWLREHTELSEAQVRERVRESIAAVALDVDDVLKKDRENLSGGMAKRVAIARAIAADPVVLFYDEPTTGLDPVVSGHIHELVFNMHYRARADGRVRTSIIVTHDKELLRRLRPRILMLDDGMVVFDGSYDGFVKSTLPVARAYLDQMPVLHARPVQ